MSPNRFAVTTTSKSLGREIRCMAIASTKTTLYSRSGNSWAMTRAAVLRHKRDTSNTLALSTEVSFPRACGQPAHDQPHHAFDFPRAVDHDVVGFFTRRMWTPPGLAKVDVSGQLSHKQNVHPFYDLSFERRGVEQNRMRLDRPPDPANSPSSLRSFKSPASRTCLRRRIIPFQPSNRREQNRLGRFTGGQSFIRERSSVAVDRVAPVGQLWNSKRCW